MAEIMWDALEEALKNQEACDRYNRGYRNNQVEKEPTELDIACDNLKKQIQKGKVYGIVNNVLSV